MNAAEHRAEAERLLEVAVTWCDDVKECARRANYAQATRDPAMLAEHRMETNDARRRMDLAVESAKVHALLALSARGAS